MSMMESLLQGAQGAGAPAGPMPPMGLEAEEPEVEETESQDSLLQTAIDALIKAHTQEQDPEDAAALSKLEAGIRTLIAKRAKEKDTALGIGPKEKHMRRALRG